MTYQHGQTLPPEVLGVPARLSVNPRARRLSIRIDSRAGEAVLISPSRRGLSDVIAFARTRRDWMRERLAERVAGLPFVPGVEIPLKGRMARLDAIGGAGAARLIEDGAGTWIIRSGGEGPAFARRIEALLRRLAREALLARTDHHLTALGLAPVTVSIGDAGSRWGSCSPHNRSIRYSWRVVMAPEWVLDYLAAHEVAHLVHADHSPAYWAVVQRLYGDPKSARRWLRTHGAALHAMGRASTR